jgi:spore coat protein CotF
MNGMGNCNFGDKEQMTDLLSLEKHLAGSYNSFLLEAATPEVVRCLTETHGDTLSMQQRLFHEMNSRGWYPTPKAEEQKLMQTKQKFSAAVSH